MSAILLAPVGLLVLELTLRSFPSPAANELRDPFVSFQSIESLFVKDPESQTYRIRKKREPFFVPQSFSVVKEPGEFRIFCLGGSTVQGRPYSIETSFAQWLELGLAAAAPEKEWEVVNCGGISYASYRLLPILEECLNYQPDLFILCMGHNEFLEDRSYGQLKAWPEWAAALTDAALDLRVVQWGRQGLGEQMNQKRPGAQDALSTEVDALLDYQDGLSDYSRDEFWTRNVTRHFRRNLESMIHLAQNAGVPVVVVLPPSNLADTPPFKSEHRGGFTEADQREWVRLTREARAMAEEDMRAAVRMYQHLTGLDPLYAEAWFDLGKCHEALGKFKQAGECFLKARELDVCPLRMTAEMESMTRQTAKELNVPIFDAQTFFANQSRGGVPDNEWLIDHVHPTIHGHQLIALEMMKILGEQSMAALAPNWRETAEMTFSSYLENLGALYFLQGEKRLKQLQIWARGGGIKRRERE